MELSKDKREKERLYTRKELEQISYNEYSKGFREGKARGSLNPEWQECSKTTMRDACPVVLKDLLGSIKLGMFSGVGFYREDGSEISNPTLYKYIALS